jgi:hypothetical protein
MARDYKVVIDLDAIESLPKSGRRREEVITFLKWLSASTRPCGDFRFEDRVSQRIYDVSLVAGFTVTWWIDDPVESIRIVDIRPTE